MLVNAQSYTQKVWEGLCPSSTAFPLHLFHVVAPAALSYTGNHQWNTSPNSAIWSSKPLNTGQWNLEFIANCSAEQVACSQK